MPVLRRTLPALYTPATTDDMGLLDRTLGVLRLTWLTEIATPERIAEDCAASARQLEIFETKQSRALLRTVAVPGWEPGGHIESLLPMWASEHTDLISRGGTWMGRPITPLGDQIIGQIGGVVREGFAAGTRHEELAVQIAERFDVGRSRATLIGRDQTNKLNGRLMEADFEAAGQPAYIWRTSRDERVRPTHVALEGTIQSWASPPSVGHPGQDIQCRCTPAPVRRLGQPSRAP